MPRESIYMFVFFVYKLMKKQVTIPVFEERQIPCDHVLNRAVLVYGASGSGKSVVIVDMLNALKPHVDQIIVFAPTDKQNQTYSSGIVPLPFIHYDLTPELLAAIWDRQEALSQVYKDANELRTLERLYARCPRKDELPDLIAKTVKLAGSRKQEIIACMLPEGECKAKCKVIDEGIVEFKRSVYKRCIERNRASLLGQNLDDNESSSLKYHNINPRLVVIFDDCTDLLEKYKNNEVVKKIFYQGRHVNITAIIALHTDKSVDAAYKKSAAMEIFTEPRTARSYIGRSTTGFEKDDKVIANAAVEDAFGNPSLRFQKLYWDRLDNKWYKFTAVRREGFSFCSDIVREFADEISASHGQMSSNNRFLDQFK